VKIIKRSGAENTFDKEKIENAVAKANITVEEKDRLSEGEIGEIAQNIEDKCSEMNRAMDVETIQDWVEATRNDVNIL
jgi:ribonucleoside-triphosphate reductase (formate)